MIRRGRFLPGWLDLVLRLIVGGVFIYASLHKIAYPDQFARSIDNYHLVPYALLHPMALLLPWLEIVCGATLILGPWRRGAAWLLAVMTTVFIGAIGISIGRGLDISCGCFSTEGGHTVGISLIIQDLALLFATLIIIFNFRGSISKTD